ncbi:MAG: hypothetical protein LIO99_13510 [Clostridiales bacterium]|nr:hypothetical protein [Clostridiales bacterium]
MRKKVLNLSILNVFVLVCVLLVYRLWEKDFTVPFFFDSDGVGALLTIKNIIMGNDIWEISNLNAPHAEPSYLVDFFLQGCIIKALAFFIKDIGTVANLYWLLTYIFTATTTFCLLKKCKCNAAISFIGAVAYTFLPYHYYRTAHFWLMGLYMIPVGIILILDILDDTRFGMVPLSRKKIIKYVLISVLFGMSGLYYSFFLAVFIVLALLIRFFSNKSKYFLYAGICMIIVLFLPAFIFMVVPAIIGISSEATGLVESRSLYEMVYYALSPIILLLPIPEHRIDAISKWTAELYTELGVYSEQYTAHLGVFMSFGLIVSLVYFFINTKNKNSENDLISLSGRFNAFAILFGSSGGFCLLIGLLLTTTFRCFNRISVFIAIFSDVAACVFLQGLYGKLKIKSKLKTVILYVGSTLLSIICVLDQTTSAFADFSAYDISSQQYVRSYDENEYEYLSLKSYIQSIEEDMEDSTKVLQFPLVSESTQFRQSRVAVVSDKIQWSSTVTTNSNYYWLCNLSGAGCRQIIDIAILYGFEGIMIDSSCYADYNDFLQEKEELEQILLIEPIVNSEEDLFYYSFDNYIPVFEETYGDINSEALVQVLDDILLDTQCNNYTSDISLLSGDSLFEAIIFQGDTQYGPYVDLEKGTYQINIVGCNLLNSSVSCTCENGEKNIEAQDLIITDNYIQYTIEIQSFTEDIEFILRNEESDMNVFLFTYTNIDYD